MSALRLGSAPGQYVQRQGWDIAHPSLFDPARWVFIGLRRKLLSVIEDLPASNRIIDFGCGTMPYRQLFSHKFREYLGADLEGNTLADCTIGADGILPLDDGSVDAVLSTQVLEHVPDPAAYLAEAHRVLRPGGSIILSTHGLWVYHPDPTDFWRWTPDGLRLAVTKAGFRVERMESVLSLPSVVLQLWLNATYRRIPGPLRHAWAAALQLVIGWIERLRGDAFSSDAVDYLVVASRN